MSLTHEDVKRLLELLNATQFDEMHLETDGLKLTLRRGGAPVPDDPAAAVPAAAASADPAPSAQPASQTPAHVAEIRAPLLGTFYGSPKPGADPFVTVGAQVGEDTVIGIIEVMKLMNSVAAGIRGEIVEILARDGQLVEYGEVLMRVNRQGEQR